MIARTALYASLILSVSVQAHALCKDDLQDMKPRIDHAKVTNVQRYYLALKWWGRAQEAQPGSETECLNFLARARKALDEPLPAAAGCTVENANLPQCQGGGMGAANAGPMLPIGMGQGGGGGGGGGAVGPATPVTQGGGATPFTPPASVGVPSNSGN